MSDNQKRFDDWQEVDCNDCARYWDSSCDGVKTAHNASKKPCSAFLATRSVVIPEQIKRLQNRITSLWMGVILLAICVVLLGVAVTIG